MESAEAKIVYVINDVDWSYESEAGVALLYFRTATLSVSLEPDLIVDTSKKAAIKLEIPLAKPQRASES
jgi:hypothetical protein